MGGPRPTANCDGERADGTPVSCVLRPAALRLPVWRDELLLIGKIPERKLRAKVGGSRPPHLLVRIAGCMQDGAAVEFPRKQLGFPRHDTSATAPGQPLRLVPGLPFAWTRIRGDAVVRVLFGAEGPARPGAGQCCGSWRRRRTTGRACAPAIQNGPERRGPAALPCPSMRAKGC